MAMKKTLNKAQDVAAGDSVLYESAIKAVDEFRAGKNLGLFYRVLMGSCAINE